MDDEARFVQDLLDRLWAGIKHQIPDGDEAWSPWFGRGAENCQFRAELIDFYASDPNQADPTLEVGIFHKNAEDTGDGTAANDTGGVAAVISLGEAGAQNGDIGDVTAVDLKELVRFKYTWSAGLAPDWIRYRMLTPAWFDASSAN